MAERRATHLLCHGKSLNEATAEILKVSGAAVRLSKFAVYLNFLFPSV